MTYYEVEDDEWIRLHLTNQKHACCDCNLIHDIDFKIVVKGKRKLLYARFRKNKKATAALRRQEKKNSKP
jgi:hypothetical protein